ncbi:MAG: hypothetical protein COV66_13635 [Nitrospinae bacterium CG11_big_fil_rev_8_21_14_0_20_45_15]|nr:MAG: hypothetical protein COV66_13635 [Nitrospinae bacterium CG11_big_fil_rev_8_21_14_0_20_45_15]
MQSFPYKAVVFDWAYTLVDLVEECDEKAFERIYQKMQGWGWNLPEYKVVYDHYREVFEMMVHQSRSTHQEARFEEVLKLLLLSHYKEKVENEKIRELLREYYEEIYKPRKVYDETIPVLQELQGKGVRMGIISNTTNPDFMKDYERELLGLSPYFEFSIYSSGVPFRKPHPSIYEIALTRLSVPVEEILFVGDSPLTDIAGPQAVGMHTAWLNREDAPHPEPIRPHYVIHSLADLLEISQ